MHGTWKTEGGSGGGTIVIAVLVVIVFGLAGAAAHAAEHALDLLVHVVLITVAVIAGLSIAAGVGLALHARRTPRTPPWTAEVVQTPASAPQRAVEAPAAAQRALPQPRQVHVHFHGVDPMEVAQIIQQQNTLEEN